MAVHGGFGNYEQPLIIHRCPNPKNIQHRQDCP